MQSNFSFSGQYKSLCLKVIPLLLISHFFTILSFRLTVSSALTYAPMVQPGTAVAAQPQRAKESRTPPLEIQLVGWQPARQIQNFKKKKKRANMEHSNIS